MNLHDAASLQNLTPDNLHNRIIQPKKIVEHLPGVRVEERERRGVINGREISSPGVSGSFRVESEGELLAIYNGDGTRGVPEVVLCAAQ